MRSFIKNHLTIIAVGGIAIITIFCNYLFVKSTSETVESLKESHDQQREDFEKYRYEVSLELEERDSIISTLRERLSIVDEAVNSKDKRMSRVKHVREAILKTIRDNRYPNVLSPYDLAALSGAVVDASEEFDVPKNLILAIMKRESAFNPKATSHAGAQGLMQIMPATAKECADDIGKRYYDNYSIRDNVRLGAYYIWKMLRRFDGDVGLAIRAYNAGPTIVQKVISQEIADYPAETKAYVQYVLESKKDYEKLGL